MEKLFALETISDNTTLIIQKTKYFRCLMYLLTGKDKALLIDCGVNAGDLRGVVAGLTSLPVEVALTHGHLDHIGCAWQFGGGMISKDDEELLKNHLDQKYLRGLVKKEFSLWQRALLAAPIARLTTPPPVTTWRLLPGALDLGGRRVEVVPTPGHTRGGVCFRDRANRMLFSGDTVCDWGVLLHHPEATSVETYLETLRRLKEMEPFYDAIYPGHHGVPVKKGSLDDYIACAEKIIAHDIELAEAWAKYEAKYKDIRISLPK